MAKKVKRLKFYIIAGVLIVIFLPPFVKYQALCYKNRKLEDRIAAFKKENKKLAEEKFKLETDIVYIEKKAREKIGLVRKGEIVIKESPKNRKK